MSRNWTRGPLRLAAALAVGVACLGCGNTLYAIQANAAASRLEEAEALGAAQYAAYEYYLAKAHLEKAQSEAAEADYGDATQLASIAEEKAQEAIELARAAHKGAGR